MEKHEVRELTAEVIAELSTKLDTFAEQIQKGTSDSEHFMSLAEIETLMTALQADTRNLYSDLVSALLANSNEKALVRQKKASVPPRESN